MFDPVDPKQSLPNLEEGILRYWREEDIFKRSLKQRSRGTANKPWDSPQGGDSEQYSFYDGPPFATGLPHYGHLLAGTIKDVIPRYQTMRGKYVERRFGWDCHGLPIENMIEQENNIKNKQEIEERGVGWFNDLCRASVQRYTGEWRKVVERMGRWVDMDWDYRTMDAEYMESMWWAFSELYRKNLLYEGHKPMHICPRCVTPLSNFEVTQGYKDVDDLSVIWKFKLLNEKDPTFVLAWTTTPWSTLSTMGLSIHPDALYVKALVNGEYIIFAKERLEDMLKESASYEVVDEFAGNTLVGAQYEHIVDWYGALPEVRENPGVYHLYAGDYVDPAEGTGIVTINGSYGEIDMEAAKKNGIPFVMDVDMTGHFTDMAGPYAGMYVKDAEKKLIADAEAKGKVWRKAQFRHSYPHCWRCDSPLLNYATSSWFVKVEEIKEKMLRNNAKTEWMPATIRDGRYGKWLEGARDWAISRNRYWGTPLPIWRNEHGDMDVIGSRDELMNEKRIRFTKITALRHGESEGNLIPIYQGKVPGTNLTQSGRKQAKELAKHFKNEKIRTVYCSPLSRTKQTAEILAKQIGAEVRVDERLREVSFGEYEGKTVDFSDLSFLKARRAHKLETGKPESIYHFEGMETWNAVAERIGSFLHEILPKHRSEHVLVVTHADPIQNIRSFFTGQDPMKLSHQPYPRYLQPYTFFWDHDRCEQMDLHKDRVDEIRWQGSACEKSVQLTLVRHGETDWNIVKKYQGGHDLPLNDKGKQQAAELAKKLRKQKFDVVVSSDLKRAAETAQALAKELKISVCEQWEELRERGHGDWEGQLVQDVLQEYPCHKLKKMSLNFHHNTAAKGERLSDFLARAETVCLRLLKKYPGKKVLLVSHGGTEKALRTVIENLSYEEAVNAQPEKAAAFVTSLNPFVSRIPEVVDCWFESGSMPYAQRHYPFEVGDRDRKTPPAFPADFIAEGLDQTRAWFYTLMVLSTALFNETPFRHVVVNGIVLAEDGKKMSKRLRNYPDPMEVVSRHGADAVRFTLMSSPAVRAEDLRFSEKLVEETVRNVLLPLWNTYSFFITYANAAKFEPVVSRTHSSHPLDMWIRAEVQDLVNRMTKELNNYDLSATCNELHETIDALTNWYIRLSRRRFAGKGAIDVPGSSGDIEEEEQHDAIATLYDVLLTVSQLLAPFCPYVTEAVYLNLVPEEHHSIHMTDWPEPRELSKQEKQLLAKNRLMRLVVSLGLSIRAEQKIKNRQPLAKATAALPPALRSTVQLLEEDLALLRQELNVKEIAFVDDPGALAESYVQVDARKVGPRLGARVQEIIQAGKKGEFEVEEDGSILVLDEQLAPDEARVVYRGREGENVAANQCVVVSLDTTVTDA
ncbi:MAG TPA: class I tRNA ligase family protein, partial [Candidatus Peribacteraceae bacterium]|nr:class I tRNA ligase family protein [Candidatus Peribacteraceae bacterium]